MAGVQVARDRIGVVRAKRDVAGYGDGREAFGAIHLGVVHVRIVVVDRVCGTIVGVSAVYQVLDVVTEIGRTEQDPAREKRLLEACIVSGAVFRP